MLTSINVGEDLLESLREKLLATVLSVKADTFLTGFLLDNSSDANIIKSVVHSSNVLQILYNGHA